MLPHFNSKFSERLSFVFAILVFTFSFGFLFYRTFFGVDFFDEPFYAALALRFFNGQKLFVDELNLVQTFALITYPFFKLYWLLHHSLEGVILFLRQSLVALTLVVALVIFGVLKESFGRTLALLASVSCALFFPGNIITLGYNSLGTLFLTLGLLLLYLGTSKNRPWPFFISGVCLGISSLAYITFCSFTALLFFYLGLSSKDKNRALYFALGVALVFLFPFYAALTRWTNFQAALSFRKEYLYDVPSFSKIILIVRKFFPKWVLLGLAFYGFSFFKSYRRFPGVAFSLLALSPLIAVGLGHLSWGNWALVPFYLSLLAAVTIPLVSNSPKVSALLKWVYLPSFVAGSISALTSASGHINAQVGLVPAVIVSLILIHQGMRKLMPHFIFLPVLATGLLPFLSLFFTLAMWSDASWKELTDKVTAGPLRGLYTTPQKRNVLDTVYRELEPLLTSEGPLLVYPNFSSVYLISTMPPAKGVTWYQNSGRTNEILAGLYEKQMNPKSRVIRMKIGHGAPIENPTKTFNPNDPLNRLIESTHTPIKDTEWYTLFAPKEEITNPQG